MKTSLVSSAAIAALIAWVEASPAPLPQAANNKCSANNCLRAVRAGSFPNRPTAADCSSFLHATVTPPTHTITVWTTITPITETATTTSTTITTEVRTATAFETIDVATNTITTTITAGGNPNPTHNKRGIKERGAPAPTIPAYASSCPSAGAYSSACSCIGIFPSVTTAATPTTVVTSTATATATTTVGAVQTETETVSQTTTQTEGRTATVIETVTVQPPRPAPTVSNPGFDDGQLSPWSVRNVASIIGPDSPLPKRSEPYALVMRVNSAVAEQRIDNLNTATSYRVKLWYSVQDDPFLFTSTCQLDVLWMIPGTNAGARVLGATMMPRVPSGFVEFVTNAYQPPAESVNLMLRYICASPVRGLFLIVVDDVSIEAAT